MIPRSLQRLELPKILAQLETNCACALGRAHVNALEPVSRHGEVLYRLGITSQARHYVESVRYPSFGGLTDVSEDVQLAVIGSVLDPAQLLAIGRAIGGMRRLAQSVGKAEAEAFPLLVQLASPLPSRADLEKAVDDAIDDAGEIKDEASRELLRVRRTARSTQAQIQTRLRAMIADTRVTAHLQDAFVTVRDGRYCLPVKAESRGSVPGIVHDRSSSGNAFFVEPQAVVEMNNRLRELAAEEREAELAVLRALSGLIGGAGTELQAGLQAAGLLDFAFAKAQLSLQMEGQEPRLQQSPPGYHLKAARHPLVEKCRANDILLGEGSAVTDRGDFQVLLLTGPNTGGKTVVLKTLGLLVAMVGCGLHIPVGPGSWLSLPPNIYVDIGDEQSIEQSLSTFSGHLGNIIDILRSVREGDLVLFDEIGAGTDPDEGAALAKAILRQLSRRGALVVATTHYGELKHFALSAQRFENASVEFDPVSLRPTYHLRIGVPGASNALDIALQLGLAPELVTRARRYLGTDRVEAEAAAQRLEETQRELQSQTEEARRSRLGGEELQKEFERRLAALEAEKQREIEVARKQARQLVDEAQHEADAALRSLRQAAHHGSRENKGTEEARHRLRTLRERLGPVEPKKPMLHVARPLVRSERPRPPVSDFPLAVGQWVHLRTLGREGEIVQIDGARAQVRVGAMKVEAKVADLEAVSVTSDAVGAVSGLRTRKSWGVAPEIHLLGKNGEEAIDELEKYLDDAVLAGMGEVRVIHGRGTGALRTAIHRWLKVQGAVSAFELAPQGEGGEGATVVHLG